MSVFRDLNYGFSFPLFTKVSVAGEDIHPLFDYLTAEQNPDFTGDIGWNFEKFLVDREGNLTRRFRSKVTPDSNELVRSEEHTSELQSRGHLVCRLLLEKKKRNTVQHE